jgi:uncharacterized protein (TIGR03067 family)
MEQVSPAEGPLDHEQWLYVHLQHAELHLSFLQIGTGDAGSEQEKEKTPMGDQERIQGTWDLVSGEYHCKPLSDEVVKDTKLVFSGDKFVTRNKDRATEMKFRLNPDQTPREIDVDMDGSVGLGIYDLDGDCLKILHGEVGNARPATFDPKAGSNLTLLILKREPH